MRVTPHLDHDPGSDEFMSSVPGTETDQFSSNDVQTNIRLRTVQYNAMQYNNAMQQYFINPFTAMLAAPSLWKRPTKAPK